MIRFASLGSGSAGNALLVESGATCLMVDCGFGQRETLRRLARLERQPEELAGILVTHEHRLASRCQTRIELSAGELMPSQGKQ